ncbi:uncharacterized protein LOC109703781 [Ananas comosus]|uniref:Uncharacterized protein LOC109703781 n=1 Tax=Ananas comosus TaxID=4615 RepID=A0A6P5EA82_ANACO|nr:uncharacterized protein LOC109703781 [Ananas comosus]
MADDAIPTAVSLSTSTMADSGDNDGDAIPAASWASLPRDLVGQIISRLTCTVHYLRAVFACRRWANMNFSWPGHRPLQPPVALFCEFFSRGPYYNPATGISYYFSHSLQAVNDSYCFGASHGWLLLLGTDSFIHTFNPVTSDLVTLPQLFTAPDSMLQFPAELCGNYLVFPDTSGNQVVPDAAAVTVHCRDLIRLSVLSSDPADDKNFTMLIVLNHIADIYLYFRMGVDAAWVPITIPLAHFHCSDLAPTRNKKIYTVDGKKMAMLAFDLSDPARNITVSSYTISGVPRPPSPDATFLLESANGSLLLVNKIREVRAEPYDAVLVVFRLDLSAPPQARALPVADIGAGNALFICEGGSGCFDISAFPRTFSANHIYFFRPFLGYEAGQAFEAETLGIFSLEKGELAADSGRLLRGWPYLKLGKVRWLFFNFRFIRWYNIEMA